MRMFCLQCQENMCMSEADTRQLTLLGLHNCMQLGQSRDKFPIASVVAKWRRRLAPNSARNDEALILDYWPFGFGERSFEILTERESILDINLYIVFICPISHRSF